MKLFGHSRKREFRSTALEIEAFLHGVGGGEKNKSRKQRFLALAFVGLRRFFAGGANLVVAWVRKRRRKKLQKNRKKKTKNTSFWHGRLPVFFACSTNPVVVRVRSVCGWFWYGYCK